MKKFKQLVMRCEGEGINGYWKFTYEDDTTEEFYAYESTAKRMLTDECVWSTDRVLSNFLDKIWSKTNPYLEDEFGAVDVTYDGKLNVIKIEQQASE